MSIVSVKGIHSHKSKNQFYDLAFFSEETAIKEWVCLSVCGKIKFCHLWTLHQIVCWAAHKTSKCLFFYKDVTKILIDVGDLSRVYSKLIHIFRRWVPETVGPFTAGRVRRTEGKWRYRKTYFLDVCKKKVLNLIMKGEVLIESLILDLYVNGKKQIIIKITRNSPEPSNIICTFYLLFLFRWMLM